MSPSRLRLFMKPDDESGNVQVWAPELGPCMPEVPDLPEDARTATSFNELENKSSTYRQMPNPAKKGANTLRPAEIDALARLTGLQPFAEQDTLQGRLPEAQLGSRSLESRLPNEARGQFVLDNAQLERVWCSLEQHTAEADGHEGDRINYDGFCQVSAECQEYCGAAIDQYFRASVFLKYERDVSGSISILAFFNYLMRKNGMLQMRMRLGCFDEENTGFLSEPQLQNFLVHILPELGTLQGSTDPAAARPYAEVACRRFMFHHARRGRLRIRDLLNSSLLAQLLEMRQPLQHESSDPEATPANWFSSDNVESLRQLFAQLDTDGNGSLSLQEFSGFNMGTMTALFMARVFEEHAAVPTVASRHGEMDLAAFVEFVLAWEDRGSPASLRYFFPVLDMRGKGYLTQVEVYEFFKEVHAMWCACGQYPELVIEDVKDEIWDMVRPADPLRITLADLQACNMGGVVVAMLADVNLFWEWDNRESLILDDEVPG